MCFLIDLNLFRNDDDDSVGPFFLFFSHENDAKKSYWVSEWLTDEWQDLLELLFATKKQ